MDSRHEYIVPVDSGLIPPEPSDVDESQYVPQQIDDQLILILSFVFAALMLACVFGYWCLRKRAEGGMQYARSKIRS